MDGDDARPLAVTDASSSTAAAQDAISLFGKQSQAVAGVGMGLDSAAFDDSEA